MIVLAVDPTTTLNVWLLIAGALSTVAVLVHVLVGGREIARPLLDADNLDDVVKFTSYYCWHLVTFTLVAMAVTFGLAALDPSLQPAAWVFFALAVSFAGWSFVLAVRVGGALLKLPQWFLFALIAAPAGAGLWFGNVASGAGLPT